MASLEPFTNDKTRVCRIYFCVAGTTSFRARRLARGLATAQRNVSQWPARIHGDLLVHSNLDDTDFTAQVAAHPAAPEGGAMKIVQIMTVMEAGGMQRVAYLL